MHAIRNRMTPRSCVILLYIFFSAIVSLAAAVIGNSICAVFLLPAGFALIPGQMQGTKPLRRNKPLLVACASLIWLFICVVLNFYRTPEHTIDGDQLVTMLILLFFWIFVLFPSRKMTMREMHHEILAVGILLNVCYLPFTLLGILTVFTGKIVRMPFGGHFCGIEKDQLFIMSNPNTCGRVLVFCILFCVYALFACKGKKWKIPAIICIVFNFVALAHTQSRTCILALALAAGMLGFRVIWQTPKCRRVRVAASILAFIAAFVLVLCAINIVYDVNIKLAGLENMSRMSAQYNKDYGAAGRMQIWKNSIAYMQEKPSRWIFGIGMINVYGIIENTQPGGGVHSSYLEALMRGGILYGLLMIAFLIMLVKPCWKLMLAEKSRNGAFIIPVFVAVLLMIGAMEAGLFVNTRWMGLIFMMFAGYALRLDDSRELYD